VGSQAGEENAGAFLKFSKTVTSSREKYPHTNWRHLFSYALFSGNY